MNNDPLNAKHGAYSRLEHIDGSDGTQYSHIVRDVHARRSQADEDLHQWWMKQITYRTLGERLSDMYRKLCFWR